MPALILSLLGPFRAKLGDRELDRFRTNKVQALLAELRELGWDEGESDWAGVRGGRS